MPISPAQTLECRFERGVLDALLFQSDEFAYAADVRRVAPRKPTAYCKYAHAEGTGAPMPATQTPNAADFPVHRRLQTRWSDNDHYGHVNNVVYYTFFDTAVNGWLMEASGTDVRALPAIGVVAETSCRFLRELSFPDDVTVGIRLEHRGRSSVGYELALFKAEPDGLSADAYAVGRFVHVYVDIDTRKPVDIPEPISHALKALA